jgi:hypothetical protein
MAATRTDMLPITILWGIVVTGIILLLGLAGVCGRVAYRAVNAAPPQEPASATDAATTRKAADTSPVTDGGTGGFVFNNADEHTDSSHPEQHL